MAEESVKLFPLKDLTDGGTNPREYDVVAVHRWGGNEMSWKREGDKIRWLEDLLPSRIGSARVMSFNYRFLGRQGISTLGIRNTALALLKKLAEEQSPENRKLVFIGHDLGGVIIKQALVLAIQMEEYCQLAARTSFLVFFGTPHRAPNQDGWERIACGLIFASGEEYIGNLSEVIETSSQALKEASDAFSSIEPIFNTMSIFQDTLLPPVVPKSSATFETANETIGKRVKTHVELGCFSDAGGLEFDTICEHINRSSNYEAAYFDCLRTLSEFGRTQGQSFNYKPRLLYWLQSYKPYEEWLKMSTGYFSVYGISTLDLPFPEDFLRIGPSSPGTRVVSFLFDSRDVHQSSLLAMLSSLAFQLLCMEPPLFDHISLFFSRMIKKSDWRVESMWTLLRTLVGCNSHKQAICLIGAIDQCEASNQPFLNDILDWVSDEASFVRIVTTSGKKTDEPPPLAALDLDNVALRSRDSDLAKASELGISRLGQDNQAIKSAREELNTTLRRTIGMVRQGDGGQLPNLATTLILESIGRLPSWSARSYIEAKLEATPNMLEGIYLAMVGQIPLERWSWSRKVLSWMVWSCRPLTLAEIEMALVLEIDTESIHDLKSNMSGNLAAEIEGFLGSMVRVENGHTHFLHASIREALIAPSHGFLLDPQSGLIWRDGDTVIAQVCLNYLRLVTSQALASSDLGYGLVDYAVQFWHVHCGKLESDRHLLSHFFRDQALIQNWASLYWNSQHPKLRGSSDKALVIAAEVGGEQLINALLEDSPESPDREAALEAAIARGDSSIVQRLVDAGASSPCASLIAASFGRSNVWPLLPGYPEHILPGWHPIHQACESGHLDAVKKLLELGTDVNVPGPDGMAPLHLACQFGHTKIVETLIEKKASIDSITERGWTPLHLACGWQQPGAIKLLLKESDDIGALSISDGTSVHLAAKAGRIDILNLLFPKDNKQISRGNAQIFRLLAGKDGGGSTPLHLAARGVHKAVVSRLLELESQAGQAENKKVTKIEDDDGNVPLHLAALNGNAEIVKLIVEAESEVVGEENNNGFTPLHLAVRGGHVEAVKHIVKRIEDKAVLNAQDASGSTPLHMATRNRSREVVALLLESGAQPSATDRDYRTPLVLACDMGYIEIVQLLLHAGVDVNLRDDKGYSALAMATEKGYIEIVRLLISPATNIDSANFDGDTPLLVASREGFLEITKSLVEAGADLGRKNGNGCTSLFLASENGHDEIVDLLLDKYADPNILNDSDQSPLYIACKQGYSKIVKSLLRGGAIPKDPRMEESESLIAVASTEEVLELLWPVFMEPISEVSSADISLCLRTAISNGYSSIIKKVLGIVSAEQLLGSTYDDGSHLLHIAARNGNLDIVEFLLAAKTDIELDPRDDGGRTPLSYAAENGHLEIAQRFAKMRQVDKCLGDDAGRTPLSYAAEQGHAEVVQYLLDAPNSCPDHHKTDSQNRSPLWYAAQKGDTTVVKLLLERDEDVNAEDVEGDTPLHQAARNGNESVIDTLMLSGKVTTLNATNNNKSTPLYLAAYHRSESATKTLVRHKADPNIAGASSWTPLHAGYDTPGVLRILIEDAKMDVDARAGDRRTPLHIAARYGYDMSVRVLLELGADVLASDEDGNTPLHYASRLEEDLVRLLVSKTRSKANTKNWAGRTPFLEAVDDANISTIRIMATSSLFDMYEVNKEGHSALWMALNDGREELVETLLELLDFAALKENPKDLVAMTVALGRPSFLERLLAKVPADVATHLELFDLAAKKEDMALAKFLATSGLVADKIDEHGWNIQELVDSTEPGRNRNLHPRPNSAHVRPSSWSSIRKSSLIQILDEKATRIKYEDDGDSTPACILADHPAPAYDVLYFEVTIINAGETELVGIGFCHKDSSLSDMPGWEQDAWGYHGDDGGMFHKWWMTREFSKNDTYGTGQVIGCYIDTVHGTARFTKDGKLQKHTFHGLKGRLYPMVGLHSQGAEIQVNFGPDGFKHRDEITGEL